MKSHPPYTQEIPAQVEENDTMIHEIFYIPLNFDQEDIRKLQEKDTYYAELIENMKLKMRDVKEITV